MAPFPPRLDLLPAAQRELWPALRPVQDLGFVLYGGTAIALRLGHRQSVDFDFFSSRPLERETLRRALPLLRRTTVQQDSLNTLEVVTPSRVKLAFFGGLGFGRAGNPELTADGVMRVASLVDLMATKLKVILQRAESKDYVDLAAMLRAGVRLEAGLAAAEQMFKPTFPAAESLKALGYFEGGDLVLLGPADRKILAAAVSAVRELPAVRLAPDLASAKKLSSGSDQPGQRPRMGI